MLKLKFILSGVNSRELTSINNKLEISQDIEKIIKLGIKTKNVKRPISIDALKYLKIKSNDENNVLISLVTPLFNNKIKCIKPKDKPILNSLDDKLKTKL
tara:strand:- start:670 stop:969 length:300 start_codon:yes stop_codon:yes gene_type:complete